MNLFFDTSALVKIFHDESGSVEMRHLYFDVFEYFIYSGYNSN